MKKTIVITSTFFLATFFLSIDVAAAQGLANVCDGPNCSSCHIVDLANNLIQWLIGIVTVLFAVLMTVAGFGLVFSNGNPSALSAAKSKFVNAMIGFMIVLAAWLLVDTIMRSLVGNNGDISGWGFWADVKCWDQSAMKDIPEAGIPGAPNSTVGQTGVGVDENGFPACGPSDPTFPDCGSGSVTISGNLVPYQGAQFDAGIVGKVRALHQAVPGLRLSGGHRTAARNAAVNGSPTSYHLYGRAADFVGSPEDMRAGEAWANANGAVEALIHNAGSGTHLHVAF